jgi:MoxR-like ATPase
VVFTSFSQETKMTESASASESKAFVLSYLSRVLESTSTLCLEANQEKTPNIATGTSGDLLIRRIAKQLLQACHPHLIGSPLPQPLVELEEQRHCTIEELLDDEEDDDESRIPGWKKNRTDHLRSVLRALSPITLDAGAHICSSLVASNGSVPKDTATSAFILFSKWLPIAPQLAPLVSDLFHLDNFPCPLDYGVEVQDVGTSSDELQLVLAEAAHGVYEFYAKRGEHSLMTKWWRWGRLFAMLLRPKDESDDVVMKGSIFDFRNAIRWHAARAIGYLIDLRPAAFAAYLDRLEVRETRVSWVPHPWILDQEKDRAQFRSLKNVVSLWDTEEDEFRAVSAEEIRDIIPLHSMLAHFGKGIVFVKDHAFCDLLAENAMNDDQETHSVARRKHLILTPTTSRNLSLLGAAMCTDPHPPPILVCGPPGSGKSSLVRESAHYCCSSSASSKSDDLLELHVDEETDSKTLIGSFTTTDIPGEFSWRPGALTQAVRSGKWVLMEDVDTLPSEIQAAIVQLLENRMLPLGSGKYERCHPKFRLFGTCTTNADYHIGDQNFEEKRSLRLSGKKLVTPSLWRKVHVQPLAFSELKEIGESLHPSLPPIVSEAALNVLKVLDRSGRSDVSGVENPTNNLAPSAETTANSAPFRLTTGRHASVRDFLKLLSRISHTVIFERNVAFVTESQRTLCLAETVDVFAASCPSLDQRKDFITTVAAPHWGITADLALSYIEARQPSIMRGANHTEIGRAKIPNASYGRQVEVTSEKFAPTNFSKRLMESIGVCISENEPTLLVGETGCGKTTLLQQLARYADRELIVQNLSLQTDSTDLLGGYRPLEMSHIARKAYLDFVDIFVSTFSRKQNADFLKYASSVLEKGQWKKVAQCFRRAAALGLAKVSSCGYS